MKSEKWKMRKRLSVLDIETWPKERKFLDLFAPEPQPLPEFEPFDPDDKIEQALNELDGGDQPSCRELLDSIGIKIGTTKNRDAIENKIESARKSHRQKHVEKESSIRSVNAENYNAFVSGATLDPHFSRVFGYVFKSGREGGFIEWEPNPSDDDERQILTHIIDQMSKRIADGELIAGWNFEFDVRHVVTRCRILDILIPFDVRTPLYSNSWFMDLQSEWSLSNRSYEKLDDVARMLGMTGKVDLGETIDGEKILPWMIADDAERLTDYIRTDGDLEWAIAEKMFRVPDAFDVEATAYPLTADWDG